MRLQTGEGTGSRVSKGMGRFSLPKIGVARAIILHFLQFGKELLHQTFLVGFKRFNFLNLGRGQIV